MEVAARTHAPAQPSSEQKHRFALTCVVVCAADENLLHEARAGGAALRGAQPV